MVLMNSLSVLGIPDRVGDRSRLVREVLYPIVHRSPPERVSGAAEPEGTGRARESGWGGCSRHSDHFGTLSRSLPACRMWPHQPARPASARSPRPPTPAPTPGSATG